MLLSVIVPCYNGQAFILDLIESIERCNQDLAGEMEILVIDDGSTDHSLHVLKQRTSCPYFRVIRKKHGGIAETRNYGLANSRGDYVAFCDQDDLCIKGWSPFLHSLIENDADLLISNYVNKKGTDCCIKQHISKNQICNHSVACDMVKRCLNITAAFGESGYEHIPRFYPSIWNSLFKRSTLVENGISLSRFVDYEDDWKLLTDTLLVSNKVLLNTGYWYQHTDRKDSESHRNKYITDYFTKRRRLREYYLDCLSKLQLSHKEKRGILALLDRDSLLSGYMNNRQKDYREYLHAMKECPYYFKNIKQILSLARSKKEFVLLLSLSLRLWGFVWGVSSFRGLSVKSV